MLKKLGLKKKVAVAVGVSSALVLGNFSHAAANTELVTSVVGAFTDLLDTALELAVKIGPIGVGIVVAVFGVILAISSSKKVGNVATR